MATGDVNGDGAPDIITAPGVGADSLVRVFDGLTGELMTQIYAYPGFNGGVFIAAGDFTGDGKADIVTGADVSGGSGVRVFDFSTGTFIFDFYAYPDFFGGVRVAAGDVTGDGIPDIVTGPGPSGGPLVRVFDGSVRQANFAPGIVLDPNRFGGTGNFFAYPQSFTDGIYVAAGDFGGALGSDGTARADIVVGTGSAAETGAFVRVFDSVDLSFDQFEGFREFGGGVRVGVLNNASNNRVDLIAARGPGGMPATRIFAGQPQFAGDTQFVNVDQNFGLALIEDLSLFFTAAVNRGLAPATAEIDVVSNDSEGGVFAAGTAFETHAVSSLLLDPNTVLIGGAVDTITTSDAAPLVQAAITRFQQAAGLNAQAIAKLEDTKVVVQDLAPGVLGLALGDVIFLDDDAAGAGWYLDPTPLTDEEFASESLHALAPEAQGRVDLLTVLLHELGHHLGADDFADDHLGHLMVGTLPPATRRLPRSADIDEVFKNSDLLGNLLNE